MSANLSCVVCGVRFAAKRSDALYCKSCYKVKHKEWELTTDEAQRHPCLDCGKLTGRRAQRCLPCRNRFVSKQFAGASNPNWKEGRVITKGYVYRRIKEGSPGKGKGGFYRAEHILVWEAAHGPLPKGSIIHHMNGDHSDNRLENLTAVSRRQHNFLHTTGARNQYEARIQQLEAELAKAKGG